MERTGFEARVWESPYYLRSLWMLKDAAVYVHREEEADIEKQEKRLHFCNLFFVVPVFLYINNTEHKSRVPFGRGETDRHG